MEVFSLSSGCMKFINITNTNNVIERELKIIDFSIKNPKIMAFIYKQKDIQVLQRHNNVQMQVT